MTAGSTSDTIPAVTEAEDDGTLANAASFPHGFEGLGVRIGWVPPASVFERPTDEVTRIIQAVTDYNIEIFAAAAAGDAQRTRAASEAKAVVIRQIGNSTVRIIGATGVVATGFVAVALSLHAHVAWGLAGTLGGSAVGAATLSLRWIIARRAGSTAESLPPAEQSEEVDHS